MKSLGCGPVSVRCEWGLTVSVGHGYYLNLSSWDMDTTFLCFCGTWVLVYSELVGYGHWAILFLWDIALVEVVLVVCPWVVLRAWW